MAVRALAGTPSTPAAFVWRVLPFLVLGGIGQLCLAQDGNGWALYLGLAFFVFAVLFSFLSFPPGKINLEPPVEGIGPLVEGVFFLLILTLGIYLRAKGANRFPEGIFADRAEVACGALRILHDHWRPFLDALSQHVPELCVYYMAAAWFKFFGASPEIFAYFDVILSVSGIILMYLVFRQLTGPRASLLAFFFLAIMRWNFVFAHQIYFQSQTILFMGLTLVPLLYALRNQKPLFAAAAGLAMGAGLYSYQSFKAVPFLAAAFLLYEFFWEKEKFRKNREVWVVFGIVFILAASPLVIWMIENGALGRREPEVSVLVPIHAQNSLLPLWENIRDVALVFNHRMMDGNSQSNFQHHRLLDDITGVLFVLGFCNALLRVREKVFFIALSGVGIMCLPGLLSIGGSNLGRLLGASPYVALVCGLWLAGVWDRWKAIQPSAFWNRGFLFCAAVMLSGAGYENYETYFSIQARLPECVNDCSWAESRAGRFISRLPEDTQCFLTSRFYGHPTVKYLSEGNGDKMHPLELNLVPRPSDYPKGSAFCFLLDEFKGGTLHYLESLYPGGWFETVQDPLGNIPLYIYRVSASALEKFPAGPTLERGFWGVYRHNRDGKEKPFLERWDPILNFNFRDLPMTGTPLFIHWRGQFKADQEGLYQIWGAIFATSQGLIQVDQKGEEGFGNNPLWRGNLKAGWHRLDFFYQDSTGSPVDTASLLWKTPGMEKFDFLPNEVLGKIGKH